MADGTKIEWTDATVNAVNGCSVLSAGCKRCYAMKQAHRVSFRRDLVTSTAGGQVWNGKVYLHEPALLQPLAWKRPRRIFWNAHGDLFHESVPDEWIDRCFAVMALTPQHQHQVLTKRAERMRAYLSDPKLGGRLALLLFDMNRAGVATFASMFAALGDRERDEDAEFVPLPLPNVWLGVSVEDQRAADERIPHMLATPAAVRFLSCEPLLGPVELELDDLGDPIGGAVPSLDWVIAGGESGPGARPMHPDWARSLRDQCAAAGVPFFFKQWGEFVPCLTEHNGEALVVYDDGAESEAFQSERRHPLINAHDREFWRVGKKLAGRLLDGVEHDGMPA